MNYGVTDKYRFSAGPQLGHVSSKSSFRSGINNNFYTYGGRMDAFLMLPGKIELNSDVNFDFRQRIAAFDQNTNIIQWNASIGRKVLKDKSGKIFLVANDILNQNRGYNRVINEESIIDSRFLRVSRYVLLKFEWSFNKKPTTK
jgi:hypothetical protein